MKNIWRENKSFVRRNIGVSSMGDLEHTFYPMQEVVQMKRLKDKVENLEKQMEEHKKINFNAYMESKSMLQN